MEKCHDRWDVYLRFTQFVYNTTSCLDSTGYPPAFLVYGCYVRSPLDNALPDLPKVPRSAQQYVATLLDVLENATEHAADVLTERKEVMTQKFTKKVCDPSFQVEDKVYLHHPVLTHPSQSGKLASQWKGPYYIIEKLSDVNVRLRSCYVWVAVPGRIHVNRLKRAVERMVTPLESDIMSGENETNERDMDSDLSKPMDMNQDNLSTRDKHTESETHERDKDSNLSKPMVMNQDNVSTSDEHTDSKIDSLKNAQVDDAGEIDSELYYEVEKIMGKKKSPTGDWLFRVKWLSFPSKYNQWVRLKDLNSACQKLVRDTDDTIPIYKSRNMGASR